MGIWEELREKGSMIRIYYMKKLFSFKNLQMGKLRTHVASSCVLVNEMYLIYPLESLLCKELNMNSFGFWQPKNSSDSHFEINIFCCLLFGIHV